MYASLVICNESNGDIYSVVRLHLQKGISMTHHFTIITALLLLFGVTASAQQQQNEDQLPRPLDQESGWQIIKHSTNGFSGLEFPSKDTGYVIMSTEGGVSTLLCSTNKGESWDSISSEVHGTPHYYNSQIAYSIVGGKVWKTKDGGRSWNSFSTPDGLYGVVRFFDSDTGATLGIGRSTDKGATWTKVAGDPAYGNSYELCCADKQVGFMVGANSAIDPSNPDKGGCAMFAKTSDAGLTWGRLVNNVKDNFKSCQSFDKQTVYCLGELDHFYRTLDGGQSWDTINMKTPTRIRAESMFFLNKSHGIIVGWTEINHIQSGVIFASTDSGSTWQQQQLPASTEPLYGVVMLNDSVAFAAGEKNLYRTVTGGQPLLIHQHPIDFQVQTFPNPTPGLLTIKYQLPSTSSISFRFYDLQGQTISLINPGVQEAGLHQIQFDGTLLSNGTYFFQLTTPADTYTGSFSIVK